MVRSNINTSSGLRSSRASSADDGKADAFRLAISHFVPLEATQGPRGVATPHYHLELAAASQGQ